jgi:arginine:pyruvate transaminase
VLAAIAARYSRSTGRTISTDQVIFMPGTQSALFATLMALAETGDEVIVPEPFYVTYDGIVAATGARQVAGGDAPETGFHLTAADLRRAMTPRTRVLLLNSPSNPSGAVLSAARSPRSARCAPSTTCGSCRTRSMTLGLRRRGLRLAVRRSRAGGAHGRRVLAVEVPFDDRLSGRLGGRAGRVLHPHAAVRRGHAVRLPAVHPGRRGLRAVERVRGMRAMRAALEQRGRRTVEILGQCPAMRAPMPEGGMFVFADVRPTGLTGETFALGLLAEENIAVMPGESFGKAGAGHVRISLTAPLDVLEPAVAAMVSFAARRSAAECCAESAMRLFSLGYSCWLHSRLGASLTCLQVPAHSAPS